MQVLLTMTKLRIDQPDEDLFDLLFVPKDAGKPQVVFSANKSESEPDPNDNDYFIGPIHVSSAGVAHGMGVIATRDITAGECLFVTRPAVSVNVEDVFKEWSSQYESNSSNDNYTSYQTQQNLLEQVSEKFLVHRMNKIIQSGDDADRKIAHSFLLQLANGEEGTARKAPVPDDLDDLLHALVGKPKALPVWDDDLRTIDEAKLLEIIRRNAFGPEFIPYESVEKQWIQRMIRAASTNNTRRPPSRLLGLYPVAAMINHSCVPNALRVFACGEWMVVHACSDIAKGAEITWSYLPPVLPYPQRSQQLRERHGFVCQCVRCKREAEAAACSNIYVLPEALRTYEKPGSIFLLNSDQECRLQFTQNLLEWERQNFQTGASSPIQHSNEVRRYWKIGNASLFMNYLNAVLIDLSNTPEEEAEKIRANVLMVAMELHFGFVSCHYACTEHLSVMHLCYEIVSIMHTRAADQSKTLAKLRFWTEQLKKAHLTRYGPLGNSVEKVRAIMKHTQVVLRNKDGTEKTNFDFI